MPEKIFFQWQNDVLLKSIYPKRLEKLCDFLVHYKEIDLWKENEKMSKKVFEEKRKKYEKKQAQILIDMVQVYKKQRKYFLEDDVVSTHRANFKNLKEDELEKVAKLHGAFQSIKNNIYNGDARKEKIFVAQRLSAWEEYRKKVNDLIFRQKRRVNIANANLKEAEQKGLDKQKAILLPVLAAEKDELDRLESQLLKMVEEELTRLNALSSSYNKIEKRKLDVKKKKEKLTADKENLISGFNKVWRQFKQAEDELWSVQGWIKRFKNAQGFDKPDEVGKIVTDEVDWGKIGQVFETGTKFFDRFKGIRDYLIGLLKNTNGLDVKLIFVRKMMENIQAIKSEIDGKIGNLEISGEGEEEIANLQAIISQVLLPELERLADYHFALDRNVIEKTDEFLAGQEAKAQKFQKALKDNRAALAKLKADFAPIVANLAVDEDEELVRYVPEKEVTANDIVIDMANTYRASLTSKTHQELLEEIVHKFWNDPERFPLWLQYMVIHFSGMRYASAHGSWADPKELLSNLRTSMRADENRKLVDPDDVDAQCEAKISYYDPDADKVVLEEEERLNLRKSRLTNEDQDKFKDIFTNLHPENNLYTRRKALHDLKAMEDKYEVEEMEPSDVLEALKDINETEKLPEWMWNEIIAMTELRVQEAKDPNWEKLTPEQEVEKNSGKWEKYRAIMNQWKADNLTDWRKEHESSGQLIVTRAVCNEVAEHIQHMRGHEGAAGLTEKPNWYKWEEREFDAAWPEWKGERPYFKRPRQEDDFKVGASILWLRYVRDFPNEWRIANPLETKEKDELIRAEYLVKRGPGNWVYTMDAGVPRRRTVIREGLEVRDPPQYLRWMHEATVAEVAKTAEGTVILTFETALPYEDRRLSTIGVFKRYPGDLMHDQGEDGYNPAFVGYVPEGEIPVEQLKQMLDWNKILRRRFKTQAELKAYQDKYIRSKTVRPTKKESTKISIMADKTEWAPLPPETELYRALNWGEEPLVSQAGLSALFKQDDGRVVGSNFNPLPIFSNSGTWSAIVNSLIIPREDIDKLIKLQMRDTASVESKMNWLVYDGYNCRPYWCRGTGDWKTAKKIWWGTIVFGGQLVLTDGDATFNTKLPQENTPRDVPMKRLVCFRKSDWGKTHATHPWLIHRATEVNHKDKVNDAPRGIIYSPLWSPLDWDFAGGQQPDAFYIPTDWLKPYKEEPK